MSHTLEDESVITATNTLVLVRLVARKNMLSLLLENVFKNSPDHIPQSIKVEPPKSVNITP